MQSVYYSVTSILNVTREIDNFFPGVFSYKNVRLYDVETSHLLPHWDDTFKFISNVKYVNSPYTEPSYAVLTLLNNGYIDVQISISQ